MVNMHIKSSLLKDLDKGLFFIFYENTVDFFPEATLLLSEPYTSRAAAIEAFERDSAQIDDYGWVMLDPTWESPYSAANKISLFNDTTLISEKVGYTRS